VAISDTKPTPSSGSPLGRMLSAPNVLSLFRVAAAPFVVLAIFQQTTTFYFAALALMILAEASDVADGMIARRFKSETSVGKIIDPMADSLYRAIVFLGFMEMGWMPFWMVAIIFSRDIIVSYLRIFTQQRGITMSARLSGKVKAVMQGTAQIGTVGLIALAPLIAIPGSDQLIYASLALATLVTAWSAVDYISGALKLATSSGE
jgi:CDP-diacylglycerol--glycerol-3-phosphate 3-phosphatidyltransferase